MRFPYEMKTFRNYANYDQHKFCKDLRDVDWESVVKTKDSPGNVNGSSVVNDLWTSFKGSFVSIVDKHAPLITKKVRGLTCPWMNGSIKREIRQREFLLNKARRSNLDEDWSAYRRSRNRVTKLVRDSRSKYSRELIDENSDDPKKFWKTVKQPSSSKDFR